MTLIGTSPNILVSRLRQELLGEPFRMFDFTPVGLGIVVAGLAFLVVGWWLLPDARRPGSAPEAAFQIEPYLSEVRLPAESPLVGKAVGDLEALGHGDVAVVAIIREKNRRYIPQAHWTLFAGDILVLESDPHALTRIVGEAKLALAGSKESVVKDLPADAVGVADAVIMPDSPLIKSSPSEFRLRERYAMNLLAVSRNGQGITTRLRRIRFQVGDVLLLQGALEGMPETLASLRCLPMGYRATGLDRSGQDYLPVMVLGVAMALVGLELMPVTAAFFGAAVFLVLFRMLSLK